MNENNLKDNINSTSPRNAMTKKQHLFFTIPLFGVFCCIVLFLLLPFICDRFLLPRLLNDLPFSEKEFSLSRISPWLVRGTLTLADDKRPTIAIPRFEVHSTPQDLLRGKISRLLIDSASLEVDLRGGAPVIHGLPFFSTTPKRQEKPQAFLLPVGIDHIVVRNLALTLNQGDSRFINLIVDSRLEVEYSDLGDGKKQLSTINGHLRTKGDLNFAANVSAQGSGDGYQVNIRGEGVDISQFLSAFAAMRPVNLSGALSVACGARLDQQGNLTAYQATAKLYRFRLTDETFVLENGAPEQPVVLSLSGDLVKSNYSLKNIAFTKPERIVFDLEGEFESINGIFSGSGRFHPERTKGPVKITFLGQTGPSATSVEYKLESAPIRLEDTLQLSPVMADGQLLFSNSTVSGDFNSRVGSIRVPSSQLELVDVALNLPFVFPVEKDKHGVPGSFSIEAIHYRNIPSAKLQAKVSVSTDSIDFTGLFTTPFASELQMTCTGIVTLAADFSLGCRLPETFIDESALPPYVGVGEEFAFSGKVSTALNFSLQQGVQGGDLTVGFHDGNINHGPNSLSDINLDVVLPRLPLLQSGPAQLCTIGQADFGSIRLTDGRIRFRVEDEQTIFLEKSTFHWCGGRVETTSFSVSAQMKELEATLYCDRLKFTELLAQFGIDDAEGEGSLNGRLPLFISSEGVVFDDGFLFSTPGNSGIVRFKNTAQLRQGIPSIDQSAYLDYSMRALENFSYNWTKLTFNSELDQLLITMQLDGKPSEPLPFGYKNGTIIQTDKGPGLDHPIRLDVNFRLPLQEMFQYGKNIQSIMENM